VPVLDERGEIRHTGGVSAVPGLYAIGLHFLRRRKSAFLDGVGADAQALADHIATRVPHGGSSRGFLTEVPTEVLAEVPTEVLAKVLHGGSSRSS
jgi:hypothetical protein